MSKEQAQQTQSPQAPQAQAAPELTTAQHNRIQDQVSRQGVSPELATLRVSQPKPPRKPTLGESVNLVLANGRHHDAEVVKIDKDRPHLVELRFLFDGEPNTITSAPFDPSGRVADSWHFKPAA